MSRFWRWVVRQWQHLLMLQDMLDGMDYGAEEFSMIGGIVIEVSECKTRPEVIFVDCADRTYSRDTCAILVEKNETSLKIQVGDSIWWQGRDAMWTPAANYGGHLKGLKQGVDWDIIIPRVGYSGLTHPDRQEQTTE